MFKTHLELNAGVGQIINSTGTQLHHINPEVGSENLFIGKGKFKSKKKQEIKQIKNPLPRQAILTWCRAQCTTERGEEQKEAVSEIFNAIIILPKPPTFFSHHHYHLPLSRCE